MLKIPDRLVELLRNQIPYAGTDLPSNPAVVFLADLVAEVNRLSSLFPPEYEGVEEEEEG